MQTSEYGIYAIGDIAHYQNKLKLILTNMAPIVLSPEEHEEIFLTIKNAFQDFALFDKLVSNQLKKLIADSNPTLARFSGSNGRNQSK